MPIWEMTLLIALGSLVAGFLGSLTGLGGGVVMVPLLTLVFGVDIQYAIGASLVSVIATSSGAASAYVREGFTNIRIGMVLEIATVLGALTGAWLAAILPTTVICIIFGLVLIHSAIVSGQPEVTVAETKPDAWSARLKLAGEYHTAEGVQAYEVQSFPWGFALMGVAGMLSGLLGIGSGAMKVIAMDHVMKIPFKVATTTSNFMIGVTAAASASVYLHRGYIHPGLSLPVILGVLVGSLLGTRVLVNARTSVLRRIFCGVILILGIEMILKGLTRKL